MGRALAEVGRGSTPVFEVVAAPLPLVFKVLLAASLLMGAGGAVAMIADGNPLVIVTIVVLASVPVWFRRRQRMRVAAFSDRLVVHNGKTEHLIPRSEIADFEIGTPPFSAVRKEGGIVGPAVYTVGRAGWRVPLQVTAEKVARSPLSVNLAHLQEWLASEG